MFKCQKCKRTTRPNESMRKVVTKLRPKTYVNVIGDKEKISTGTEIVEELQVCERCASKINKD